MYLWFFRDQKGIFMARHQGKIVLPFIGKAGVLNLPETGETGSIWLGLSIEAFGPYDERSIVSRPDGDSVMFIRII